MYSLLVILDNGNIIDDVTALKKSGHCSQCELKHIHLDTYIKTAWKCELLSKEWLLHDSSRASFPHDNLHNVAHLHTPRGSSSPSSVKFQICKYMSLNSSAVYFLELPTCAYLAWSFSLHLPRGLSVCDSLKAFLCFTHWSSPIKMFLCMIFMYEINLKWSTYFYIIWLKLNMTDDCGSAWTANIFILFTLGCRILFFFFQSKKHNSHNYGPGTH